MGMFGIAGLGADDRCQRHDRFQEPERRRMPAAVVPNFQDRGAQIRTTFQKPAFGQLFRIRCKKHAALAKVEAAYHAVGIHIRVRALDDRRRRAEEKQAGSIPKFDDASALGLAHRHLPAFEHPQKFRVDVALVGIGCVQVQARATRLDDMHKAAQMVGVPMGEQDHIDGARVLAAQKRNDAWACFFQAAIDQHRLARGRGDERRVAMPHV